MTGEGEAEGGPLADLLGARVRRVDLPSPILVAISLAKGEERPVLLLSAEPRAPGVGCVPERPKGEPASGFATFLRTHLEGAALARVVRRGTALEIVTARQSGETSVVLEPSPNVVVVREGRILGALSVPRLRERGLRPGMPWTEPTEGRPLAAASRLEALYAAGEAMVTGREVRAEKEEESAFARALRTERQRLVRRLQAIEKDGARAEAAPGLREDAAAILAHGARLPTSRTEVTLELDGRAVTIPAGQAPIAHAQALYARARKAEAALEMASARAAETRAAIARLDAGAAEADEEGADLALIARRLGLPLAQTHAPRAEKEERKPYRTFTGHAGRTILVGRGPKDNDQLTTKVARPHDLWLHVRGAHGSHVVVPLERGESCPAELLVDAAHLAVRFSELEGTTDADVTYVEKRYVKKPKGSAPGAVTFERDKTLALRVEPERLARLLGRAAG